MSDDIDLEKTPTTEELIRSYRQAIKMLEERSAIPFLRSEVRRLQRKRAAEKRKKA